LLIGDRQRDRLSFASDRGIAATLEKTMSKDSELKKVVLEELSWEPSVDAAHIGVTAKDGVITLTGHVDNYSSKSGAEKAASRVKGVKAVAEEIEVKLPYDVKRSDEDIAAAAVDRLGWNSSIPDDAIEVKVEKGWVTLSGTVDWHFEKEAAERDIRALSGVVGVSNQVLVKPTVSASNVKDDIEQALHRSWYYDPDTIQVNAVGGKIKLTGNVTTWNARRLAGMTAWSVPGATSVDNAITVDS
jgi:osmotically-inducible protein OsmY